MGQQPKVIGVGFKVAQNLGVVGVVGVVGGHGEVGEGHAVFGGVYVEGGVGGRTAVIVVVPPVSANA